MTNQDKAFKVLYIPNGEYLRGTLGISIWNPWHSSIEDIVNRLNLPDWNWDWWKELSNLPLNYTFSVEEFEVIYE